MARQPRPPGFFQTRWPGPGPGPGQAGGGPAAAAVLAGALGTAIFIPWAHVGIGWVLAGLAVGATLLVAGNRIPMAAGSPADRWQRIGWAGAALALLSVLTFRNAWWLATLCVLGALGCTAVATVGGRSVRSILFSVVAAPIAAVRGLVWVGRTARASGPSATVAGMTGRVAWSVGAALLLVVLFGALLASADAAFDALLSDVIPEVSPARLATWSVLLGFGALLTAGCLFLRAAPPDLSGMAGSGTRRLRRLEWGLPIGALVVLFGVFVAVKAVQFSGGDERVLVTPGLTYAEYARQGFWQLLAVTVLTLFLVMAVTRWAVQGPGRDRNLLRLLVGLLCGFSLVIVASALHRMFLYQEAYGFTGRRIFVMAFELLLGVVFLLVLAAGVRWNGSWLPRASLGAFVAMLLALAALNPDGYAAERNIRRWCDTQRIDLGYLSALSADAVPALVTLPDDLRHPVLDRISARLRSPDDWSAWNLGRQQAREALAAPASTGTCRRAGG